MENSKRQRVKLCSLYCWLLVAKALDRFSGQVSTDSQWDAAIPSPRRPQTGDKHFKKGRPRSESRNCVNTGGVTAPNWVYVSTQPKYARSSSKHTGHALSLSAFLNSFIPSASSV